VDFAWREAAASGGERAGDGWAGERRGGDWAGWGEDFTSQNAPAGRFFQANLPILEFTTMRDNRSLMWEKFGKKREKWAEKNCLQNFCGKQK
jgi:hypothetical protein